MWKVLVDIAINYIKKNLIPKLDIHPAHSAFIEKGVEMGTKIKDIYTDNIEDNKRQLSQLWDQNCEEILALGIRGAMPLAIKNPHVKKRVVAVLSQAIDDIMKDDEVSVLDLVEAIHVKQNAPIEAAKKLTTKP